MTSAPWNGMRIPQGRLLLVGDQGYGDTLQFARYIPAAAERVQDIILGCSAEMEPLLAAMPGLKERAKTLVELLDGARYLYADRPLPLEPKAKELLDGGGRAHLVALLPRLEALGDWNAAASESVVRAYSEEVGAKLGSVAQPLRAALTGRTTSPGVFDVLETLGREESLARLRDQTKD